MNTYLICPDFKRVTSGGSRFNKKLIEASQGQITPLFYNVDPINLMIQNIPNDEIILIDSLILNNIAQLISRPFIILCHLPSFMNTALDKKTIAKEIKLYKNQKIIVTGHRMKNTLIEKMDISPKQIHSIQPGINNFNKKKHYQNTTERLVWVGNISPVKGFLEMLDELKQLTNYPWHLDVYGSTDFDLEYMSAVKDKVIQYNLEHRIEFKQSLPHNLLMKELVNYDLMIQFSRFESFGMAVYEALNIGLPVIGLHLHHEACFDNCKHCYSAEHPKAWRRTMSFLFESPKELKKTSQIEIRTWANVYQDFKAFIDQNNGGF